MMKILEVSPAKHASHASPAKHVSHVKPENHASRASHLERRKNRNSTYLDIWIFWIFRNNSSLDIVLE